MSMQRQENVEQQQRVLPIAPQPPAVRGEEDSSVGEEEEEEREMSTVVTDSPVLSDSETQQQQPREQQQHLLQQQHQKHPSCRRSSGQVCICVECEATRVRLLDRSCKKRRASEALLGAAASKATATIAVAKRLKAANDHQRVDSARAGEPETALSSSRSNDDDDGDDKKNNQKESSSLPSSKMARMAGACKTILECIGEDPSREGLIKTPERWAKALCYMCSGYQQTAAEVTNGAVFSENHNEMVVVRNIDIHSLCEHHMVPFTGRVHIGYIPNGKVLGLSKLARIAEVFARRLQVQERLTRQIADAVVETVNPLGAAVVVECSHFCMVMRGVQKVAASTTTSSVRGCFETNPKTRAEFFSILHGSSSSGGGIRMC